MINEDGRFNITVIEMTNKLCHTIFDTKVIAGMKEVDDCMYHYKYKRYLAAVVGTVSSVANIVLGVTNFIRGAYEPINTDLKVEAMNQLSQRVESSSRLVLLDSATRDQEEQRELRIVSDSAEHHLQQIREVSEQVPMLVWLAYHTTHELYAGVANLKAIKNHCSRGRLATLELAEMLEYEELGQIYPDETTLVSVNVNAKEREINFVYQVEDVIGLGYVDIGLTIAILIGIIYVAIRVSFIVKSRRAMSGGVQTSEGQAQEIPMHTTNSLHF